MLQQISLQGMTITALEALNKHITLDLFFAPETTDEDRDTFISLQNKIEMCLPASFVLASLFDVEAMSNDVPEHVLENDPSLEWVICPCCDGEKWLEVEGNGWCDALFSDPRRAYAYRQVLDLAPLSDTVVGLVSVPTPHSFPLAA
jgi:hypothetical protein